MSMELIVARRLDATRYACTQPPKKDVSKRTWDELCKFTELLCNRVLRDSHGVDSQVTLHVINSTWPGRTQELADITYHLCVERPLAALPNPSQAVCTHIPATIPPRHSDGLDLSVFWSSLARPHRER